MESEGVIEFQILGYPSFKAKELDKIPGPLFKLDSFGTIVTFKSETDGRNGTDMQLIAEGVKESIKTEMTAVRVSVLMVMKAALDFGADLRSHDINRTWTNGYADN